MNATKKALFIKGHIISAHTRGGKNSAFNSGLKQTQFPFFRNKADCSIGSNKGKRILINKRLTRKWNSRKNRITENTFKLSIQKICHSVFCYSPELTAVSLCSCFTCGNNILEVRIFCTALLKGSAVQRVYCRIIFKPENKLTLFCLWFYQLCISTVLKVNREARNMIRRFKGKSRGLKLNCKQIIFDA